MADIELVIKIPEEMWKRVKEGYVPLGISKYLRNSTPLPKGHDDLIDRNEVIKSLFDYHNGKKTIGQCIDDVQTIIEAEERVMNEK